MRTRVCNNGVCDGATFDSENEPCNEQPCLCTFTEEMFEQAFYSQPPTDVPVGWIENDGFEGMGPDDTPVSIGETMDSNIRVQISINNKCGYCMCNDDHSMTCEETNCANDCVWAEWNEWTACSGTCGLHTVSRSREILIPQTYGGQPCEGEDSETKYCSLNPCPPEWQTWAPWNSCTVTCGGGSTLRTRDCGDATDGLADCEGGAAASAEQLECNSEECPNHTCGNEMEAGNCEAFLANCPTNPTTCTDVREETDCALAEMECNATTCHCPLDLVLADDGTCIQPNDCNCRVEISGALVAPGSVVTIDECTTCTCKDGLMDCTEDPDCMDCQFSEWTTWSACTVTCGSGQTARHRTVNDNRCPGSLIEVDTCGEDCPTCEENDIIYQRFETINDTMCSYCMCDADANIICNDLPNSQVDGEYGQWADWSECSSTCTGVRVRNRHCDSPLPQCGGTCDGPNSEVGDCNQDVMCTIDPGPCGANETYASEPTCEYTCTHFTPLPLGACATPMPYDQCVCAPGFVRNDAGQCVHIEECVYVCYMPDGSEAPDGPFTLPGDECITYECINGVITPLNTLEEFQAVNCLYRPEVCAFLPGLGNYVPPRPGQCCGTCEPEPMPSAECALVTETVTLTATDESNNVCQTPTPVQLSYCKGSCSSEMRGAIMINSQTSQPEAVDCKCCSGTGTLEDVTFYCGLQVKIFQVTQMMSCGCNACANSADTDAIEEAAPFNPLADLLDQAEQVPVVTEAAPVAAAPVIDFANLFG